MKLRIASWNINSVRIRLEHIERFCQEYAPDILCLQETKVIDSLFPLAPLQAMGFTHCHYSGQKSYNGVAILSRLPIELIGSMPIADSADKRHIGVTLPADIKLHNFYIPAGGDTPDPKENPAFDFKLRFVEHMTDWALSPECKDQKMVILGDFNIAPLEHDVWSHKQLLKVVSHTEPEIKRLNELQDTLGWIDTARHFIPADQKLYSWWSYRNRDWRKSNRGRRLDHIWVTPQLKNALKGYNTFDVARDWEKPSDHVPIMIDLEL